MGSVQCVFPGFSAGDSNLFRYVFNSPTNATDPSGLFEWPWSGWFGGGGSAIRRHGVDKSLNQPNRFQFKPQPRTSAPSISSSRMGLGTIVDKSNNIPTRRTGSRSLGTVVDKSKNIPTGELRGTDEEVVAQWYDLTNAYDTLEKTVEQHRLARTVKTTIRYQVKKESRKAFEWKAHGIVTNWVGQRRAQQSQVEQAWREREGGSAIGAHKVRGEMIPWPVLEEREALLDTVQLVIDVFGVIPVAGDFFDAINGAIYLARGRPADAAFSFASLGLTTLSVLRYLDDISDALAAGGRVGESIASIPVRGAESNIRPPRLSARWRARAITDPACQVGCENVARQIRGHIGGDIRRIRAQAPQNVDPEDLFLGSYRGHNAEWHFHEVVVRDGRVYDAFTGHQGLPIAEYKALWENADSINFGF